MMSIDFYRPEIARWYAANRISIFAGLSRVEATCDEEKSVGKQPKHIRKSGVRWDISVFGCGSNVETDHGIKLLLRERAAAADGRKSGAKGV